MWRIEWHGLRQDVLVWWLTGRLIGKQTSKQRHTNREIETARKTEAGADRNRQKQRGGKTDRQTDRVHWN